MKRVLLFFKKLTKGFTLVELIAVMALMAIGAAIVLPNLRGAMTRAERKKLETYMIGAKSVVQGYVDLLNMDEFTYPITEKDGVTVKNYDISNSEDLNVVLNYMNFDATYEYFIYDKKPKDKSGVRYYVDPGDSPVQSALKYKGYTKDNTDIVVIIISKNSKTGIYSFDYMFYLDRSGKSILLSYIIKDDVIVKGFTRNAG